MIPIPAGAVVVSCQARPDNPLHGPEPMALMARAAVAGGAQGIRANGPADIAAIVTAVDVPIIGIDKSGDRDGVYITPTFESACGVVKAGAAVVALDGTQRPRPGGETLTGLIAAIHGELGVAVMADVDSYGAGMLAADAGADIVASTLSGYTSPGPLPEQPDVGLVERLAAALELPVIAEGRYWTPDEVQAAFAAGAHAVVVGTAVTNPMAITARLIPPLIDSGDDHAHEAL